MDGDRKRGDLEERTEQFARQCRQFIKKLPRNITNIEDAKQRTRSSGSVAANYIEANEALSKKDFAFRIRLCRKEAKESGLWLRLIDLANKNELESLRDRLEQETREFRAIFTAILSKNETK